MLHTIDEVMDWIHNQLPVGIKPGLKRMEWMMEQLDHPERRIRSVHIGGTNGKGSTVSYLRNILQEAGYVVGTFTSPYIEHFNERISIDGKPISDEELLEAANIILPLTEQLKETELGCPTEFEVITAMSMVYFAKINIPDIVLFEVGLGGRLDSTNIIHPFLSLITNIGFDHMQFLGNTIEEIAFEKAGIIKAGIPVLTTSHDSKALDVFAEIASNKRTKLYQLGKEFYYQHYQPNENGSTFSFKSAFEEYDNLNIAMKGKHQVENASLALMAISYLKKYYAFIVEEEAIRTGLAKTNWIGRFELMKENPTVIIDGAHNLEGVQTLIDTLKTHYPNKKYRIIFSALRDKPVEKMLALLGENCNHMTLTSFDFPRASSAKDLFDKVKIPNKDSIENFKEAISIELDRLDSESEILVITGSLYFISEVRKLLKHL